jgi:hypothetical protein
MGSGIGIGFGIEQSSKPILHLSSRRMDSLERRSRTNK